MLVLCTLLVSCFIVGVLSDFQKNWWFVGPWVTGKTEIDVEPLSVYNSSCDLFAILRMAKGCPRVFFSEVATSGYVSWNKLPAVSQIEKGLHSVQIQFPMRNSVVDYNSLIQGLNKMSVIEFQGWATNTLTIDKSGYYEIIMTPIHSFYIDKILHAGSIYSDMIYKNIVFLSKGKHYIDVKIRAKANLVFSYSISFISSTTLHNSFLRLGGVSRSQEITDIIDGQLPFNQPSWIQLPITNLADEWCVDTNVEIIPSPNRKSSTPIPKIVETNHDIKNHYMIPPGHTQYIPFQFDLMYEDEDSNRRYARKDRSWYRRVTDDTCFSFSVVVSCRNNNSNIRFESNSIPIRLRCRHSRQSFLFSLLDHDGSVTHAAALLPRRITHDTSLDIPDDESKLSVGSGFPVLLSLSGVGVTARSQADSHKYKVSPKDKDYTFGFENAWLLAPTRGGAHNWEGTGFWTIMHCLEYLGSVTAALPVMRADVSRVVVSGHSRGGHGALTIATHFPDRILAVVTASGYMDRENYGDANTLFDMDMQLSYMDPQLIAIHLAMIHEHDNAQSVSNLNGIDVFIRAGSADRTVNPYFQRQIARLLHAEGINVTYSEKEGADHWYWDYESAEDGGVVFDPMSRTFMESHFSSSSSDTSLNGNRYSSAAQKSFTVTSHNPATFGSKFGIKIDNLKSRLRAASIVVSPSGDRQRSGPESDSGRGTTCYWELRPNNVVSFTVTAAFWTHASDCSTTGSIDILGDEFVVNVLLDTSFCRVESNAHSHSTPRTQCSEPQPSSESGRSPQCANSPQSRRKWQLCPRSHELPQLAWNMRKPHELGPVRQAFQHPFLIVVGTGSGGTTVADEEGGSLGKREGALTRQALMDAAKYISTGHALASDSAAPIVPDTILNQVDGLEYLSRYNLVLIGGPDVNLVSHWLMAAVEDMDRRSEGLAVNESSGGGKWTLESFPPIRFLPDGSSGPQSIFFGTCNLTRTAQDAQKTANHHGIMFTFPLPYDTSKKGFNFPSPSPNIDAQDATRQDGQGRDYAHVNRIGLMVAADSIEGLNDVVTFSFSSNVPLTRAPFSNMYGDYFIVGPSFKKKGLGGVLATGYYGNNWELDPLNGWYPDDCAVSNN